MADTFQKEIPKARVNITLDLETNGAKKKQELPLKLLVAGDFSNKQNRDSVVKRERININKNNFDSVMQTLSPKLHFNVPNKVNQATEGLTVDLTIDSLQQFNPDAIIQAVPALKNLMAMRNLLQDLKANILDNGELRRELETIIKNAQELQLLQSELAKSAPLAGEIVDE